MRIEEYIRKNGISVTEFARQIGLRRNSVYRFIRGEEPSPKIIRKIATVTNGAVQPNDFFDIPSPSSASHTQ